MDYKLYETVASLPGISSRERIVGKFIKGELEKTAEEVLVDGFGGVFGRYGNTGPVVMICGHMDEIGCMVTEVTNNGFLKVMPIGGINPEVMVSSLVDVHGKEVVRGVFSSVPPHISKDNKIEYNKLFNDIRNYLEL
jgi:putative aminopeptidase FrvX